MLKFAQHYVQEMGWSVIPLQPKGKKPLFPWKEYQTRKPTPEELEEWFSSGENNIGIVTGNISGLVVVDSDDGNEHPFGLHTPMMVKTSKGFHLYYKDPGTLFNTARIQEELVDLRGEGGFVVAPPSVHETGVIYRWKLVNKKLADNPLPPLPVAFLEQQRPQKRLDIAQIVGTKQGSRNDRLYRIACGLEGKPEQVVWNTLVEMNNTFQPPLELDEVRAIYNSASHKAEFEVTAKPKTVSDLRERIVEMKKLEEEAPSTGYDRLDQIIRGFIPSHLYTLTGETNSGKTTLACNFAVRVAQQEKKVLYLALEPDIMVTSLFAALSSGKKFADLVADDYQDVGVDILTNEDCRTYEQMERIVQENGERYSLIIIDHIGYIIPDKDNYVVAQSTILKKLAIGTKRLKTAIMIIAHPRKGAGDKAITMNDIAGSAAFKQDSTEVLILHREKANNDPYSSEMSDVAQLQVAKSKVTSTIPRGSIKLYFAKDNPLVTDFRMPEQDSSAPKINNSAMVEQFFNNENYA